MLARPLTAAVSMLLTVGACQEGRCHGSSSWVLSPLLLEPHALGHESLLSIAGNGAGEGRCP